MLKRGDKKLINSWAFYDWANSVFPLVISTAVFPIYYDTIAKTETGIINFLGFEINSTSLYTYTLSLSFLIVAIISPILSGIADYVGNKKSYMKFFCYLGSISVMFLYFFKGIETLWIGIVFLMLANIGFWGSMVFYNSYLPEVAYKDQQDEVSARGFIFGYSGSLILLLFNLSIILNPELYGITDPTLAPRISFLAVGVWWLGFSQYTFKYLPENRTNKNLKKHYFFNGLRELKKVLLKVNELPNMLNFLVSFFLYSIGVQSFILLSTVYGKTEIGLPTSSMIIAIIVIQFLAIAGSYLFSKLSKRIGNIVTLKWTVIIWLVISVNAYFLEKDDPNVQIKFYVISVLVGLVLGAIQTMSRSTYSKLIPENTKDHTTFFSFYDVTEKLSIVWGTFIFGISVAFTESMRMSILLLTLFFFVSVIILSFMKKTNYVR